LIFKGNSLNYPDLDQGIVFYTDGFTLQPVCQVLIKKNN